MIIHNIKADKGKMLIRMLPVSEAVAVIHYHHSPQNIHPSRFLPFVHEV